MAKGENVGEAYDFVPPDFNEDDFIHREVVEFRTTVIRSLWAIPAAAVAWGAFLYFKGDDSKAWPVGLAICLAFGLALKPIFKRFADVSHWKRMDWVGTGLMFFLTWLALFVIVVNPPVSDISPPQVQVSADPPVQAAGGQVSVAFVATDNAGLDAPPTFLLTRNGLPVAVPSPSYSPQDAAGGHYTATLANPTTAEPGAYKVRVLASDSRGHISASEANFTVQAGDLLTVRPAGGNLTSSGAEQVLVVVDAKPCSETQAPPCLRTVFFSPSGCTSADCAVPFEFSDGLGGWYATAKFDKWAAGPNTGHVVAEFMDHFQGTGKVAGGRIESRDTYTFDVQPAGERHVVTVLAQAGAPPVSSPAYGLLGVVAVVFGAAAMARRRA